MLFLHPEDDVLGDVPEPDCLHDLNLDLVIAALVVRREAYDLVPFFRSPLRDVETLHYRQEAMQELERVPVCEAVDAFSERMVVMRRHHAFGLGLEYPTSRNRWLHSATRIDGDAVRDLADRLQEADLTSRAFLQLRDYLAQYIVSPAFRTLVDEGQRIGELVGAIRYTVHIKAGRVTVRRLEGGEEYTGDVERTFARFRQGDVKDYLSGYSSFGEASYVEYRVMELVAQLYPDEFAELDRYCRAHAVFVDGRIARFDREVQFYLAYLDYIAPIRASDMEFCHPTISTESRELDIVGGYDLALAAKLATTKLR
ncbi:MAG: hypothetical protein QM589_10545 [Thermomicrobiales bacterium]